MENRGSETGPTGLFASIKALLATAVSLLAVRLELLSADVQEAKLRFLRLLALAVVGIFLLCLGIVVSVFLVAALFWETHRILALCVLAFVLVAAGAGCLAAARSQAAGHRFLAATLDELERDRRALERR